MKKSQAKQALLSSLLGPAGLFYSSLNSALSLTLLTLTGVLVFADQALYVLLSSFAAAIVCGVLLVRSHNRKVNLREFTLSTYIGRVSCKVIGKTRFKRDYSRPLAKAKFKRKMRNSATYALASSCLVLTGLIALPNAINQFNSIQNKLVPGTKVATIPQAQRTDDTREVPAIAAATDALSNIGIWQMEATDDNNKFKARLQGNHYQSTSEGFYRPTLTLSCDGGGAKISFAAHEVLGTEHTRLTLQFDKQPKKTRDWNLFDDYRSAYITASKPLLNKLSRSEQLQISYRPFGSDESRSIDFSLGDSSGVTRKLQRKCA